MFEAILGMIGRFIAVVVFDVLLALVWEIPGLPWILGGGATGFVLAVIAGIAVDDMPDSAALAIVLLVTAGTALGRWIVWSRRNKSPKATWNP